ncbi:hypothetical protein MKEN_01377300 [Mycena kentingensis (nom. inval.)]|nr:hypothetical protein MKEN_01377300 [Mycena kentingensis (nom. inval.)]
MAVDVAHPPAMSDAPTVFAAVAFVVDSSLALSGEWQTISNSYLMPMLRRLQETGPQNITFRAAFITYGTQDSPLLCRNFFHDIKVVLPEMTKLGMGTTSCNGDDGLAALEGLVAAVEMFDTLQDSVKSRNGTELLASHIFHFAAAKPDDTVHPQHNNSPIFDSVTWDSLPNELKKRNIHFNSVTTRRLPKYSDLHASAATAPLAPWFTVRPQHIVLVSGFATPQKGIKRPAGDALATPDSKRPKIAAPASNSPPKATQTSPPLPAPAVARTATPTAGPSTIIPPTGPVAPAGLAGPAAAIAAAAARVGLPPQIFLQLQQLQRLGETTQNDARQLEKDMTEARARGDHQQATTLAMSLMQKKGQLDKIKAMLNNFAVQRNALLQQAQAAQAAKQTLAQQQAQQLAAQQQAPQLTSEPAPAPPITAPTPPLLSKQEDEIQEIPPAQPPPNPGHGRSLSASFMQGAGNLAGNPAAMAQMQKLVEQQQRARVGNMVPPTVPPNPQRPIWQGQLMWLLPQPVGSVPSVRCFVLARSGSAVVGGADPKPETWPQTLHVHLAERPFIPMNDMAAWVNRHKPSVCPFSQNPQVPNPALNDHGYKSMVRVLAQRNTHFNVSWVLPGATQPTINAVIFSFKDQGIVGAFFPTTGVPDVPPDYPIPPASPLGPQPPGLAASPAMGNVNVPNPLGQPPNPPRGHTGRESVGAAAPCPIQLPNVNPNPLANLNPNSNPLPPNPNPNPNAREPLQTLTPAQINHFRNQVHTFLASQNMHLPMPIVLQMLAPGIMNALLRMGKDKRSAGILSFARMWLAQQDPERMRLAGVRVGPGIQIGGGAPGGAMMAALVAANPGAGAGMQMPHQPSPAGMNPMMGFNPAQFGGGGFMGGGGGGYADPMGAGSSGGAVSFQMMQNFMQRGAGDPNNLG